MISLTNSAHSIRVELSAAVATEGTIICAARETSTSGITEIPFFGKTNDTTPVTVLSGPSSGLIRSFDFFQLCNEDSGPVEAWVYLWDGTNKNTLFRRNMSPGDVIQYTAEAGWSLVQNNLLVTRRIEMVVLGSDVINNDAVANTLADVTGLSFPVKSGKRYWFRFFGQYTAAAATTGSRWCINGPTVTDLRYRSGYSLTTTTQTINEGLSLYNTPAAANASSAATGANIFLVEGFIMVAADGNVQLRFASEVSASEIRARIGSYVEYIQLN